VPLPGLPISGSSAHKAQEARPFRFPSSGITPEGPASKLLPYLHMWEPAANRLKKYREKIGRSLDHHSRASLGSEEAWKWRSFQREWRDARK